MALNTDSDEKTVYDGRMSWIGAFVDWKAIVTMGVWGLFHRFRSRYTVTDKRVYRRYGIIRTDEAVVRVADVRNIEIEQGILQWVLAYGTVKISTAGNDGTAITFPKAGHPARVKRKLEQVRSEYNC